MIAFVYERPAFGRRKKRFPGFGRRRTKPAPQPYRKYRYRS